MKKKFVTGMIVLGLLATACSRQKETAKGTMSDNFVQETMESAIDTSEPATFAETSVESEASPKAELTAETIEETDVLVESYPLTTESSSANTRTTPTEENSIKNIPEEAYDLSAHTPMEAFRKVMLSEAPFVCYNFHNVSSEPYSGYFNQFPYYSKESANTTFAIIDMDGDTMPEVILTRNEDTESVILRYHEGRIIGTSISGKAMGGLKTDASFTFMVGASNSGTAKLFFIGNSCVPFHVTEELEVFNEGSYYYHHNVPVAKDTYQIAALTLSSEYVARYAFTEDNINALLQDHLFPPAESQEGLERQDYLDKLSYLIDLKNKHYFVGAESYYYNCIAEMNAILDLCCQSLSAEAAALLKEEQELWQKGIDDRLVIDLYREKANSIEDASQPGIKYRNYGDMYLERTFALINLYYGCEFYE